MFGLIVFGLMAIYLVLLIWATKQGWRWGIEKKGWTGKKRYLGAAIGFLIVYLPVFWDWLPTVAVHQYYCATESGFWVYKTLDQWKAENPGVMEGLVLDRTTRVKFSDSAPERTLIKVVNQRFNWLTLRNRDLVPLLPIGREEQQLVDTKDNTIIARQIGFGSHDEKWGGLKFWLNTGDCLGRNNDMTKFGIVVDQFKGAGK